MFSFEFPLPNAGVPMPPGWFLRYSYFEAVNVALEIDPDFDYDLLLLAADLADHGVDDFLLHCLQEGAYDPEDVLVLPDFVSVIGAPGVDARAAKDIARILIAQSEAKAIAAEICGLPIYSDLNRRKLAKPEC
jgi:hypothetical protein